MCLAVAGELVSISEHADPLWRMGDVCFGGVLRQVSLACVPEAQVGDQLLVHVGVALTVRPVGMVSAMRMPVLEVLSTVTEIP